MLSNYTEFLVEKQILLLNESVIVYSDKFTQLLKKIKSPIATTLLDAQLEDRDVNTNYFDLDSRETISFITDKKAQQIQNSKEQWVTVTERAWNIFTNRMSIDYQNLLDQINKNGIQIEDKEFFPKEGEIGKLILNIVTQPFGRVVAVVQFGDKYFVTLVANCIPVDLSWVKYRQPIRIGRGIRALLNSLGEKFTDQEIEDFVNQWKSEYDWINNIFRNFELVNGDNIAYWYSNENYEKGSASIGQLGQSCMANKEDDFFQIYTKNPDVCSMLILKSENLDDTICGRALVWKLDSGDYFMDRVYFYNDSDNKLFRKYAQSKGWWYKQGNNSEAECIVVKPDDDSRFYPKMSVTIKNIDYEYYPYVDTLKYLTIIEDTMFLSNDEQDAIWILESTRGKKLKLRCETCDNEGSISCSTCNGSGIIYIDCTLCEGGRLIKCDTCHGEVRVEKDGIKSECQECDANKMIECTRCSGAGILPRTCSICLGSGNISCPDC